MKLSETTYTSTYIFIHQQSVHQVCLISTCFRSVNPYHQWYTFNITYPKLSLVMRFVFILYCVHHLYCSSTGHSPRLRKSKTLCIVYFLLEAWSSNLRTRICFLLKTVSQSIKYTMYRPTCNLTWGHKTKESMRGNQASVQEISSSAERTWWCVHALASLRRWTGGREGKMEGREFHLLSLSSPPCIQLGNARHHVGMWTCADVMWCE